MNLNKMREVARRVCGGEFKNDSIRMAEKILEEIAKTTDGESIPYIPLQDLMAELRLLTRINKEDCENMEDSELLEIAKKNFTYIIEEQDPKLRRFILDNNFAIHWLFLDTANYGKVKTSEFAIKNFDIAVHDIDRLCIYAAILNKDENILNCILENAPEEYFERFHKHSMLSGNVKKHILEKIKWLEGK